MNIGEEPTKKCECGEAFYFSENLAAHRDYCQKGIDAEKIRVLELQLGDKDEELSIRARMIQEYQLQVDALVKALREIAQMGSVCKDFENCSHPPCQDSCGAVLVALEALTPHPAPPCPPAPRAPVAETRVDDGGGK
jgi:hypothetical protein